MLYTVLTLNNIYTVNSLFLSDPLLSSKHTHTVFKNLRACIEFQETHTSVIWIPESLLMICRTQGCIRCFEITLVQKTINLSINWNKKRQKLEPSRIIWQSMNYIKVISRFIILMIFLLIMKSPERTYFL